MADEVPSNPEAALNTEAKRRSFITVLNARLPKKRLIAQGVLREASSPDGAILLCQLTYKKDWDLPGGVVDPGESAARCVRREITEELGLDLRPRALLAVNWLPPYRGWDDATLLLFDLGVADRAIIDGATLLRREIKGAHWVAPERVGDHVAPYTARMLQVVLGHPAGGTHYLEDSEPVDGIAIPDQSR